MYFTIASEQTQTVRYRTEDNQLFLFDFVSKFGILLDGGEHGQQFKVYLGDYHHFLSLMDDELCFDDPEIYSIKLRHHRFNKIDKLVHVKGRIIDYGELYSELRQAFPKVMMFN